MIVSSEQRRSAGTERSYLAPDNERAGLFCFGIWVVADVRRARRTQVPSRLPGFSPADSGTRSGGFQGG